jgi:crotonobetainyl-CoA:carnitine CoA-transferase CaiB-like acyl-CoA transferase
MIADILARRTRTKWLAELAARRIPCSPVHTLGELSAHPHTEASGMVLRDNSFRTVGSPLRADGERLALRSRPPALGEHSRAVLTELGYQSDEIDALVMDGVVSAQDSADSRRR